MRQIVNIVKLWEIFKTSICKVAKDVCGANYGRKRKSTAWWNSDTFDTFIKNETEKKKHLCKTISLQ